MILLLSVFLVGCTEVEEAAITEVEAQEETAVEIEKSSEKEELVTSIVKNQK